MWVIYGSVIYGSVIFLVKSKEEIVEYFVLHFIAVRNHYQNKCLASKSHFGISLVNSPGVLFPLKMLGPAFCRSGVLFGPNTDTEFNVELKDIDIFDVLMLPLSVVDDALILFCHLGAGPFDKSPRPSLKHY